jgi:hypothetical protein
MTKLSTILESYPGVTELIDEQVSYLTANPRLEDGKRHFYLTGIFAKADFLNANKRTYPREILAEAVDAYVRDFVNQNRAFGALDHKNQNILKLEDAAIRVLEMRWDGDDVVGTAVVLDTPPGRTLQAILETGGAVGVSTRGIGETSNGIIQSYRLLGVDVVSSPSTGEAVNALYEDAAPMPITTARAMSGLGKNPPVKKQSQTAQVLKVLRRQNLQEISPSGWSHQIELWKRRGWSAHKAFGTAFTLHKRGVKPSDLHEDFDDEQSHVNTAPELDKPTSVNNLTPASRTVTGNHRHPLCEALHHLSNANPKHPKFGHALGLAHKLHEAGASDISGSAYSYRSATTGSEQPSTDAGEGGFGSAHFDRGPSVDTAIDIMKGILKTGLDIATNVAVGSAMMD